MWRLWNKERRRKMVSTDRQSLCRTESVDGVSTGRPEWRRTGGGHQTIKDFERRLPDSIWQLSDALKGGRFTPQAILCVQIPKPGTTESWPLGIPTVRDRLVEAAIVNVIEPIFERDFAEHSYGFRLGRGCRDALRRVDQLLKAGYVHVVDADLKGFSDSIRTTD